MNRLIKTTATAATVLATSAFSQSTREIRGASPYVAIENEPAPKLVKIQLADPNHTVFPGQVVTHTFYP